MMPSGGSQGQGMQGVFGLPRNDTFPQFGQRATTPSQGNTRFGFGGSDLTNAGPGMARSMELRPGDPFYGPSMSGPSHMSNFQPMGMGNAFNMQTPQNTQGLNQGQVNAGVYTRPDGTISFSGGPASPMSSLTAGFLGGGRPQQNFQQNSFGPPPPSYMGGPNPGFGPSPPMNGPNGSWMANPLPLDMGPAGMGGGGNPSTQAQLAALMGAQGGGFDPWAASRAMAQPKPMVQAPQTAPASPFPAAQAPQFDMFGRATVGNRNPFAR